MRRAYVHVADSMLDTFNARLPKGYALYGFGPFGDNGFALVGDDLPSFFDWKIGDYPKDAEMVLLPTGEVAVDYDSGSLFAVRHILRATPDAALESTRSELDALRKEFDAAKARWREHQESIELAVRRKTEKIAELQSQLQNAVHAACTWQKIAQRYEEILNSDPIREWLEIGARSASDASQWMRDRGTAPASWQHDFTLMLEKYGKINQ